MVAHSYNPNSREAEAEGEPGAGEMAEQLGALAALAEDLGSVASIHRVTYNHLQPKSGRSKGH